MIVKCTVQTLVGVIIEAVSCILNRFMLSKFNVRTMIKKSYKVRLLIFVTMYTIIVRSVTTPIYLVGSVRVVNETYYDTTILNREEKIDKNYPTPNHLTNVVS